MLLLFEAENYNTNNDPDPQDEADAALQEFQKILDWKEEPEMEMENEGIAIAMTSRFDQSVID